MTQSPEKTYLDVKGSVILKQPERTFVLSKGEMNLFIINSDGTIIREYVNTPTYKPKLGELCKLNGEYSNGELAVLVSSNKGSSNNIEEPQVCQVKSRGITKTYTFNKINRIEE